MGMGGERIEAEVGEEVEGGARDLGTKEEGSSFKLLRTANLLDGTIFLPMLADFP